MSQGGIIGATSRATAASAGSLTGILLIDIPCDSSVYVKAAVYMDSGGTAFNALGDSTSTSNVIGLVESKSSSTLCDIRVSGTTPANFTGLDTTKEYFLSDTVAGEITDVAPSGTGHVILRVGQPLSATRFVVNQGQRIVLT